MGAEGALTAIVLAAGQSRRMGAPNKLLLDVGGRPVLARVVAAFMATEVLRVVVVTGADREAVKGGHAGDGSNPRRSQSGACNGHGIVDPVRRIGG